MDEEQKHHNAKQTDILSCFNEVAAWITHSEQKLSANLDTQSTKNQSSKASPRMSARDKERVKLAELRVEKSMLKQKQALQAAEEDLKLELEIVKAEAREKVLAQMSQEQETSPQYLGSGSQSIASFSPLPKRSHDPLTTSVSSASLANGSIRNHKVPATTTIAPMAAERDVTTVTGTSCSPIVSHEGQPLNVGAVEFNPNTFVKGTSSTPYASHGFDIPKENSYGTPESHALKTTERTFQDVMTLQQRQNETIIATQQQLAAAVTLPELAVSKFKGEPTEYRTFMMSFDARIQCRATTSADRLYYLNQHLEGEPRDLIEGCLHMDSEKGYTEARQLLQREYGDPYKISTAYVNKILRWAPIKSDDSQSLKRLSIFLTKCKIAMKNVSYMCVLDHAPNMQAVVSKLPPNLQNKWRDQAAKRKRTNRAPASFTDLAEFVESASDSANHPVFGKEALQSRESAKTERSSSKRNND